MLYASLFCKNCNPLSILVITVCYHLTNVAIRDIKWQMAACTNGDVNRIVLHLSRIFATTTHQLTRVHARPRGYIIYKSRLPISVASQLIDMRSITPRQYSALTP